MPRKILVIDDSATARIVISKVLVKEGYLVVDASSGEAGIKKAQSDKPDLVVVDTIMPLLDGYEVCRILRSTEGLSGIKIIVVTGAVESFDAARAMKSGADTYLIKTSDCADLLKVIRRLLN